MTQDQEIIVKKGGKMSGFCLKQGQGFKKTSTAHLYSNISCVAPPPPPPRKLRSKWLMFYAEFSLICSIAKVNSGIISMEFLCTFLRGDSRQKPVTVNFLRLS